METQIRIEGRVEPVSDAEADAYFASRARGSQLGAWVSQQSSIVPDRVFLETRLAEKEKEFVGRDVPAPPYWGGYLLAPIRLEFWQGRPNRLHDRFEYVKQADGSWRIQRLSP
jgi:pyridoxamine 5'-phosphate oxidase